MGSRWTNKTNILRDLCQAQGRFVPGGVSEAVIAANEKPPAVFIEEGRDEEDYYFKDCTGAGDPIPPDLELIKQMLNKVNEQQSPDNKNMLFEISKANSNVKIKKSRNVALSSLLAAMSVEESNKNELKPPDIDVSKSPKKNGPILEPITFKKKVLSPPETRQSSTGPSCLSSPYKPTTLANEYFLKYMKRSQLNETKKDLWTRVEERMMELDREKAKRKAEADAVEAVKIEGSEMMPVVEESKLDIVRLPQHRHLLSQECAVCAAVRRRRPDKGAT